MPNRKDFFKQLAFGAVGYLVTILIFSGIYYSSINPCPEYGKCVHFSVDRITLRNSLPDEYLELVPKTEMRIISDVETIAGLFVIAAIIPWAINNWPKP